MKNLTLIILVFVLVGCRPPDAKVDIVPPNEMENCLKVASNSTFSLYQCKLPDHVILYCGFTFHSHAPSISCTR